MTVRIHSLIRAPGARVPVPPVVPFMTFVQQPTDTVSGELFEPVVTVQVSDGAPNGDQLRISSPICAIAPVTVTTQDGIARFIGLRAGPVNDGCRLRVENLSRPQIAVVLSDPFDVLPVPVESGWSLIASGAAGASTPDRSVVVLNTTDANLLIVAITTFQGLSFPVVNVADNFENIWFSAGYWGQAGNAFLTLFWIGDPIVGANHVITISSPNLIFPGMVAFAFRAANGLGEAITNVNYGFANFEGNVTAVGPAMQIPLSGANSLIMSFLGNEYIGPPPLQPPSGFIGLQSTPYIPGVMYGCAGAYRVISGSETPVFENPIWVVDTPQGFMITGNAAIEGLLP